MDKNLYLQQSSRVLEKYAMVAIIDLATSYTAISLVLRVLVVWPEEPKQ
jgi:hypothetical protein